MGQQLEHSGLIPDFSLEGLHHEQWPQEAKAVAALLAHPMIREARTGTMWDEEAYINALIEVANSRGLPSHRWLDLIRGRWEARTRNPTIDAVMGKDWPTFSIPDAAYAQVVHTLEAIASNWKQSSTALWPVFVQAAREVVLLPSTDSSRKGRELRYRIAAAGPAAILNYVVMMLLKQDSEFGRLLARCRYCNRFFLAWRERGNVKGKLNRRWCRECHMSGEGRRKWERDRKAVSRATAKHK